MFLPLDLDKVNPKLIRYWLKRIPKIVFSQKSLLVRIETLNQSKGNEILHLFVTKNMGNKMSNATLNICDFRPLCLSMHTCKISVSQLNIKRMSCSS